MKMTLPAALFGFLIASLYGALYHLIRNGRPRRLLQYLLFAWIGFTLGHLLGAWRDWTFLPVGPINLGLATAGSLLVLVAGDVASHTSADAREPFPDEKNGV
jgi:hypothetical protein